MSTFYPDKIAAKIQQAKDENRENQKVKDNASINIRKSTVALSNFASQK
jgi:hypothetical protein